MKKLLALIVALSSLAAAPQAPAPRPAPPEIRLVLLIAVDQFRYDYLTRFRGDFTSGLARLLGQGAVFTDANLEHYPTVTAIGHATMLTGATPSVSGPATGVKVAGFAWRPSTHRPRLGSGKV